MSITNKSIDLSYTLYPPSQITAPTNVNSEPIASSSSKSYSIEQSSRNITLPPSINSKQSETSKYYEDLTYSLREVQINLNETLTYWKDVIGDKEKFKEDLGKVGHGKGRATVMSLAVNGDFADQREGYKVEKKINDDSDTDESDSE
ncbi:uncharacterized protein I206_105810 [Kwoniella pini CBS 10737]|uniref:Uncharacterized protein n=1 Tax=Kwoniella pini CBS 10737 TaxID=1296096 RepID=A0A1B9I076_9TREE|nr:uncharacterized protein I206_04630 [Kwoniella pini CBS 10737]OCF48943.1 hypothetical protein I206_04630 [Kwoniella pini CBS 10737]